MLRVGSCTVLYNPKEDVLSNIASYSSNVDVAVVVDNSDKKNDVCEILRNNPNLHYIDLEGNQGIAKALNVGIDYLHSLGCDLALTMDQDSVFPQEYYSKIIKLVGESISCYSIIGLNLNKPIDENDDSITNVSDIITSGNFVKISDFYKVGKFKEELFIDYVDMDFCERLLTQHCGQLGCLNGYSLKHTIGNPIWVNIFGRRKGSMNHPPIRYYYRYRNLFYLSRRDWNYYKPLFKIEVFRNIPKMLLFEKKKFAKLKMIIKGIHDARKSKLGKYC